MGIGKSPSNLTAKRSPNGVNVRVGKKGKASQQKQSTAANFEDLENKYIQQQKQIDELLSQSIRRDQQEAEMREKLERIHRLARRFLRHFARTMVLETHDHTRSLTDTEWATFRDMSNEEIDKKLGYGHPEQMEILRPSSQQPEDQMAAAHIFQLSELLAAVEALDVGAERSLCSWILNVLAGHKLV